MSLPDVLVIGGGVMGCASAWRLALSGASVAVLERSVPGAEASSAAAGILGAQVESHGPGAMTDLLLASRRLYVEWAPDLTSVTGLDLGYVQCGALRVSFDEAAQARSSEQFEWQSRAGLSTRVVDRSALGQLEPKLSGDLSGGVLFPDDAVLDPPLLLKALHTAAESAGAAFRCGSIVREIKSAQDKVQSVVLEDGTELRARHVVVAAGSWTNQVRGVELPPGSLCPLRGQIVELRTSQPLLERVVFGPDAYIVPRRDGRLLIGSTEERVGFERAVTARAVRDLLAAAIRLIPDAAGANVERFWCNFRPYTEDHLPLMGPTRIEGLTLATGHYRNGILLAPITAEIVCALVLGNPVPMPIEPFSPLRFERN